MAIRHSLRFRVLLGSILLLLILYGVYSFVTVTFYGDRMTQQVIQSANRMSDVVRQSTHYGMLLNRRDDVHEIITMIGTEPGVEGIRIYNKRGEIMFSTDKREEGTAVDLQAEACYACHEKEKPLSSLSPGNRTRIYTSAAGHRVLGVITPIRNGPSCSSGSCHAHPPERTVLGVLDVRLSLAETDGAIADAEQTVILFAIGMILIVATISVWYLSATVIRPVKILMNGAREVSGGNLEHRIHVRSKDELGAPGRRFQRDDRVVARREGGEPAMGRDPPGPGRGEDRGAHRDQQADRPRRKNGLARQAGGDRRARAEQPARGHPHIRPADRPADPEGPRCGRGAAIHPRGRRPHREGDPALRDDREEPPPLFQEAGERIRPRPGEAGRGKSRRNRPPPFRDLGSPARHRDRRRERHAHVRRGPDPAGARGALRERGGGDAGRRVDHRPRRTPRRRRRTRDHRVRHRDGDRPGGPAASLRTLLHHQEGRQGRRARPLRRLRHRRAPRREDRRVVRTRPGNRPFEWSSPGCRHRIGATQHPETHDEGTP